MILGAASMLAANVATLLGAHVLLGRVRTRSPATDLVVFLLLRLLLVSATVMVAGLLRGLSPLVLGLAGLVAVLALVAAGEHRRLPRWRLPDLGAAWVVLAVVIAVRLLLQVWFFAPYLGDGLAYHLPKIAEWVRSGGFTREMGIDLRSSFPAGFELVETWWVVFLHHDLLIEMAGVEFFLLGVAAVAAIADSMGWDTRTAVIAGAIFALNPAFHFQATSALNDGAVTALVLAAVALLMSGAHPCLVMLPIGLGLGVKPTFLYALPGLAAIAALVPGDAGPGPRRSAALGALAGAAVLLGLFWYLRNAAFYGNPIYPMGATGMKSLGSGPTIQRLGPSLSTLAENLACFLDLRVYDSVRAPDAQCTATFGWGPSGFALGALAAIPVLRAETLMRRLALGLVLSTLSIFSLVELDAWNMRFVTFLAALPALALARLWSRHRFVRILGVLALALQFAETFVPGNLPPETLRRWISQSWTDRSAVPLPALSSADRVAYCGDDFGLAYPLYRPDYSRGLIYLREDSTDRLLEHVDREGVTVIYVPWTLPRREAVFAEAVRRGRLRPIRDGSWTGFTVLPRP